MAEGSRATGAHAARPNRAEPPVHERGYQRPGSLGGMAESGVDPGSHPKVWNDAERRELQQHGYGVRDGEGSGVLRREGIGTNLAFLTEVCVDSGHGVLVKGYWT